MTSPPRPGAPAGHRAAAPGLTVPPGSGPPSGGIFVAYPTSQPYPPTYRPRRSGGLDSIGVALLIGLGVGVCVYAARAPVERSVVLGLTVAVALWVLLRSSSPDGEPIVRWRRPVIATSARSLVRRWQVLRFDRLVGPAPTLGSDVRDRMRRILGAELERRGLDFDSDQARRLLGSRVHELLSGPVDRRVGANQLRELIHVSARICPPTATVERGRSVRKSAAPTAASANNPAPAGHPVTAHSPATWNNGSMTVTPGTTEKGNRA